MKTLQSWLWAELACPAGPGQLEEEAHARGFQWVAGLDEVGRGPWAGPVVAAAVILPRGIFHADLRDSKLLTPAKREAVASWIKERAVTWGLGVVGPEEIDRIDILRASLLAMAQAIGQLRSQPDLLLIDGAYRIPMEFLRNVQKVQGVQNDLSDLKRFKRWPCQWAIKKGDQLCFSIAAASILAKITRDQIMMDYDKLYPGYGFGQNKGYGSRSHLDALGRYGLSPIHRQSFQPVRETIERASKSRALSLFDEG